MPDPLDLTPRERRRQAELTFAARLRRAIEASGLTVTTAAQRAGWARRKLYDVFDGARMHAGSLWALPVEVRRLIVADLAKSCGLEVRPVSKHDASAAQHAIHECLDVIREATTALGDGTLDPDEAARLSDEIREAQDALASLLAQCDEVLTDRVVKRIGAV